MFGQQRSQSGPSGLSINTGAANNLGTNTSQPPPPSGGLFGSGGSKPAGSLFGNTNTGASSAGTLFGTPSSTQGAGGLFGTANAASSAPSQAGTLFGGSAAANPAPAQTGNIFGAPASNQNQGGFGNAGNAGQNLSGSTPFGGASQNQPQPQQGSLFGGAGNTQNAPGPSLWGAGGNAQTQAAPNLFSTSTNQAQGNQQGAQPAMGASLFGQPPRAAGGLFGQAPQQNAAPAGGPSLFNPAPAPAGGPSLLYAARSPSLTSSHANSIFRSGPKPDAPTAPHFGFNLPNQTQPPAPAPHSTLHPQQHTRHAFAASIGQLSAAQQTIPGVRIDLANIRPTTRFHELHDSLQQEIAALDAHIQQEMRLCDEVALVLPQVGDALATLPADVEFCEQRLEATQRALESDAAAIDAAKTEVRRDAADAARAFRAINALRAPAPFQQASRWAASTADRDAGTGTGTGDDQDGARARPKDAKAAAAPNDLDDDDAAGAPDLVGYFSARADDMDARLRNYESTLTEIERHMSGMEAHMAARAQAARWGAGAPVREQSADDRVRELGDALRTFEQGILAMAGRVSEARETADEVILGDDGLGGGGRGGRR